MRRFLSLAVLVAFALAPPPSETVSTLPLPQAPEPSGEPVPHFVFLELFTSEGCSSCPPADAFLKRLDDAGRVGQVEVIALEEHVDYWNRQGWTDPYSSPEWTARQQRYADYFRRDAIYTPQLVLNGTDQTTGNNEQQVLAYITKASTAPTAKVRISSLNVSLKSAEVSVELPNGGDQMKSAELCVAVTERGLSSNVLRGENEGKTLTHAAVLRSLTRAHTRKGQNESASATARISLPSSWKRENLRFVVFLQHAKSLQILGAATAEFPR